ncbi:MAG: galactose oxidase-like domain-containing protein [Hyphomicrobium sp.]
MGIGVWSDVFDWPVIGIQSILTPDGRVLSFGTNQLGQQGGMHIFDVWDPVTNTHLTLEHTVHTDLFCSAAIIVPETGEILIAGGDTRPLGTINGGVADTNSFDYTTNTLMPSPTGDLAYARWYPTEITLANGKILALGGRDGDLKGVATPEIYTPGVGWETLNGATSKLFAEGWFYPQTWLASDGRIVALTYSPAGNGSTVVTIDPSGDGRILSTTKMPFKKYADAPGVMFAQDKLLTMGDNNTTWIVDISGTQPKFTQVAAPRGGHSWSNMILLADGTVMVSGGSAVNNKLQNVTYEVALWHPDTAAWTYGDSAAIPRLYHSSTLLLPDATVLSLGGGAPGPLTNLNGEIYKPDYLFNADGSLATRPVILNAPDKIEQRQDFTIGVDNPSAITKLTLVKNGSTTHSTNSDSRIINLDFTVGADGLLHVNPPDNANVLAPGYWMLFAFNKKGTPSVASIINVEPGGEMFLPQADTFLTLNGSAVFDNPSKIFTLTGNAPNQTGDVMSNSALDLSQDFTINAGLRFGAKEAGTGGIAFVLQHDPVKGDAIGGNGAHLGAYNIANGIGIEFDVSNEGPKFRDIGTDHTGFFDTDAALNQRQILGVKSLGNIEDGKWHNIQISWNATTKTLSYTVDGQVVGTLQRDLAAMYFGGANHAYFGFTAASGAVGNAQQVRIYNSDVAYVDSHVPSHHSMGSMGTMTHTTFDVAEMADLITLSGGARYNSNTNIVMLTSDATKQLGGAMSDMKIDVSHDFAFDFDVYLGTHANGGDGMSFVIHNDPVQSRALGDKGNSLGAEGIRNGLALEIDTYNNGAKAGDIAADHMQLVDTDAKGAARFVTKPGWLGEVEDGFWHKINVTWDADTKTLSYSIDGRTVGTIQKDLATAFLGGSNLAYFGFTASTGGATNLQEVRLNEVTGTFEPLTVNHDDTTHMHGAPAFNMIGSAGYNRTGGAVQLTPDKAKQAGGIMSESRIDITHDFDIKFDVFLGTKDAAGAEGIAFVLHNDARGSDALGAVGANLGAVGITNGLAIEFDTYNSGANFKDIAADHTNFFDTDASLATRAITAAHNLGNIEDGRWHAVELSWNATTHTLSYTFDGAAAGTLTEDIAAAYFGSSNLVHFGVTGATGGLSNLQQVRFASVDAILV